MVARHLCHCSNGSRFKTCTMQPSLFRNGFQRISLRTFMLVLFVSTTVLPVGAVETKAGVRVTASAELLLTVHPLIGKVNEPRTVFVQQIVNQNGRCGPVVFNVDTSQMETQNLIVIDANVQSGYFCPPLLAAPYDVPYRFDTQITPSKTTPLRVLWKGTGIGLFTTRWTGTPSEITVQTLPAATLPVASKFDTNGMWFDPATNGSGIALHHRRFTTDNVFGTWFLFMGNNDLSSWVSLQSASWQQDGSVLEGLLYTVVAASPCPKTNNLVLIACPTTGAFRYPPPEDQLLQLPTRARITFQSPTRARAEVLSLGGTVLFTSELTKLSF